MAGIRVEAEDQRAAPLVVHREEVHHGRLGDLLEGAAGLPGPAGVAAGDELEQAGAPLGDPPDLVAAGRPAGEDPGACCGARPPSWTSRQTPSREETKTRGSCSCALPLRVKTIAGRFPWLWKAKTGTDCARVSGGQARDVLRVAGGERSSHPRHRESYRQPRRWNQSSTSVFKARERTASSYIHPCHTAATFFEEPR